jgi:hypothetical protein
LRRTTQGQRDDGREKHSRLDHDRLLFGFTNRGRRRQFGDAN